MMSSRAGDQRQQSIPSLKSFTLVAFVCCCDDPAVPHERCERKLSNHDSISSAVVSLEGCFLRRIGLCNIAIGMPREAHLEKQRRRLETHCLLSQKHPPACLAT